MLLEFYGLAEPPFSITPDPRFVFLSERHREALAHLHYGITQGGSGGFVQLTGEVGTGKTTLCRLLLEELPETVRVALVLNPLLSPVELLETIAEELRLDIAGVRGSLKGLYDRLNAYLIDAYAQGLRVVVIIDEAQNLSLQSLEQVRLLTNLETPTQKLLQMVLLGQPELREMLSRPELRQLAQRITARYHLMPLDGHDVEGYLRHRIRVAGATRFPFTKLAVKRLHLHTGGVPRLLNGVADRALLAGYARSENPVGERLVDLAAREVLVRPMARLPKPPLSVWIGVGLMALVATFFLLLPAPPAPIPPLSEALVNDPLPPPKLDGAALDARLAQIGAGPEPAAVELIRLWAVRAGEASPARLMACAPLLAPGLVCQAGTASLDALSAAGRPALLFLRRPNGSPDEGSWAVLLGADALRVRLWLGDIVMDVDRLDFARHFDGRTLTVWRAPTVLQRVPTPGSSGADIDWLRSRLDAAAGRTPAAGPAEFDQPLQNALREYQAARGLRADGLPGPATLRVLGAELNDGPRLRRQLD